MPASLASVPTSSLTGMPNVRSYATDTLPPRDRSSIAASNSYVTVG